MKISVNEQAQRFYLAYNDEWKPAIGHQISVGKYRFCAIPMNERLNISEVSSGTRVMEIPLSPVVLMFTETQEETINYLVHVGYALKKLVKTQANLVQKFKECKRISVERLGEMPPIEEVDTKWFFADENEFLQ